MPQSPILTAIGVISGTSMDGIDVSVVETDGDKTVRPGPVMSPRPTTGKLARRPLPAGPGNNASHARGRQ